MRFDTECISKINSHFVQQVVAQIPMYENRIRESVTPESYLQMQGDE